MTLCIEVSRVKRCGQSVVKETTWTSPRLGRLSVALTSVVRRFDVFLLMIVCAGMPLSGCTTSMSAAVLARNQELEQQQAAASATIPNDRKLYLSLIQEMQTKGMFYASLAHVDAFEKKYGVQPDIELLRGDALRETSQPDAALQVYRTLLSSNVAARAQHGIGRALAAENKLGDASQALGAAVQLDPTNVDFLNDLAFAYLANNDMPAARVPIAQAAELAPNNKKVLANLVLYLILTGQPEAADQVAAKAKLTDATLRATRSLALRLSAYQPSSVAPSSQMTSDPLTSTTAERTREQLRAATALPAQPSTPINKPAPAILPPVLPATLAWQGGPLLQRFGDTP